MIKKYVKKPIEIQAIHFTGVNWAECEQFMSNRTLVFPQIVMEKDHIDIDTLEGTMRCNKGDYIIKGVKGEYYPCRKDIFEETYVEVINE